MNAQLVFSNFFKITMRSLLNKMREQLTELSECENNSISRFKLNPEFSSDIEPELTDQPSVFSILLGSKTDAWK